MNAQNTASHQKKIGIMGGTFDPIHIGHLILGESACQQFCLDRVLFMPSGNPPHKIGRQGATNEQRTEMVRLAIAGNPHFELSLLEMHEEGYSYTMQTLRKLHEEMPDTEFYFIMGADSLLAFDTWKRPDEIARLCVIAAAVRDGLSSQKMEEGIEHVRSRYSADVRLLKSPNLDISSHMIRQWVSEGRSIRYYVPEAVRQYIFENGVYPCSTIS